MPDGGSGIGWEGGRVGAAECWHPAGPEGGRGAADSTWILPAAYLLARPRSAQDGRRMLARSGKSGTVEEGDWLQW